MGRYVFDEHDHEDEVEEEFDGMDMDTNTDMFMDTRTMDMDTQEEKTHDYSHRNRKNNYINNYNDNYMPNNAVGFPMHATQAAQCTHYDDHNRNLSTSASTSASASASFDRNHQGTFTNEHMYNNEVDYYPHSHPHPYHQHRHPHDHLPPPRKSRLNLKHYLIIIILSILVQRYIPPPPPPNQSWNEFISTSTETCYSTIHNFILLTFYISSGCVNNIYGDLHSFVVTYLNLKNEDIQKICSIGLHHSVLREIDGYSHSDSDGIGNSNSNSNSNSNTTDGTTDGTLHLDLISKIVGQDHAMKHIVENLRKWNHHHHHEHGQEAMNMKKPLSMLLTGPSGVGKYETAKLFSKILLHHECNNNNNNSNDIGHDHYHDHYNDNNNNDGVLILQGLDYALEEINGNDDHKNKKGENENGRLGMIQTILDHIYKQQGSGTVIIIKRMENISSSERLEFLRLLNQSRVTFVPTSNQSKFKFKSNYKKVKNIYPFTEYAHSENTDNDHDNNNGNDDQTVEVSLGNVAFFATTDIGADKVFEVLLKSHGVHDSVSYDEIRKAVQYEVEKYFGNTNGFGIVAPFWPLRYWDMEKVIEKTIQQQTGGRKFKNIEIHESAARHLINPKLIDYFELKLKEGSYLFSKNGGHDLIRYRSILDHIDEKIVSNSFYSKDDTVLLEYDGNGKDLSMKLCSESSSSSSSTNMENTCSTETWFVSLARLASS